MLPEPLDGSELGEEPVPAEVEAIAVELHRLGDAADRVSRLEDRAGPLPEGKHVRRGQAGGAGTENDVLYAIALVPDLRSDAPRGIL